MNFELISDLKHIETIARGAGIRELSRLTKKFGKGRWLKRKGVALVRMENGQIRTAEVHWYEAHGLGKRLMKIKRFLK